MNVNMQKKNDNRCTVSKKMNFLFQNILTFYCLNKERRMSTSQKKAVTVKLFMLKYSVQATQNTMHKAKKVKVSFTPLKSLKT